MSHEHRRKGQPPYGVCEYEACKDPAVNARVIPSRWSNRFRGAALHTSPTFVAELCIKHDREFGWASEVPLQPEDV